MDRLEGRVAVITGGSKGIGEAIVRRFCEEGATVYNLDIDEAAGYSLQDDLRKRGNQNTFLQCDLASIEATEACFKEVFEKEGRLDILVNNAGIAHIGNVEQTSPEAMDRVYAVNIKGVYHCLKTGIPMMKRSGGGAILNVSSIAAVVGLANRFAYSMSKGAVMTMTYSIAKDYIHDHIRCNAIAPARVHTPFVDGYLHENYPGREKEMFEELSATQPIGRMGTAEEIAGLAAYLCSDEAAFITGSLYPIDGGFITLNT